MSIYSLGEDREGSTASTTDQHESPSRPWNVGNLPKIGASVSGLQRLSRRTRILNAFTRWFGREWKAGEATHGGSFTYIKPEKVDDR